VTCGDNQLSLAPLLTTVRAPELYLSQECYIITNVMEHMEEITDYCNTSPVVNLLSPNKVRPQYKGKKNAEVFGGKSPQVPCSLARI